jgi:hypothetical protein
VATPDDARGDRSGSPRARFRAAAWAWATAAVVAALCALAAWRRWRFLDGSPYPMGVDGYYYAVQLRSLLDHGHLVWPAAPLAFWLMAPAAALAGPIAGAKLGALAGGPAYLLGRRLGGGRAPGLIAATAVTAAAGSFYLSVEFVKQGVGVTVALTALVLLARALERPTRGRLAAAAAGVVAAVLTHKVAAGLVVVAGLPAALVELRARGRLGRRRLIRAGLALAGLVALAAVAGALWPARFVAPRDLALGGGLLSGPTRWGAPALDLGPGHVLWMGHEALIAGMAALGLGAAWLALRSSVADRPGRPTDRPGRPADRAMAAALAGLGLVVALPWLDVGDAQGLAFRLRLIAFVPLALVGAAALGAAVRAIPLRPAERATALIALAAAWLAIQPATRPEGVIRTHPAMAAAVRALDGVVPPGGVVVTTERHIAFMASWYARVPVALDPATVAPARRWRLMPLAFIGARSPLDRALMAARLRPDLSPPRGLHPDHPDGLVLVPEATWAWVLGQLPPPVRRHYAAWHTI